MTVVAKRIFYWALVPALCFGFCLKATAQSAGRQIAMGLDEDNERSLAQQQQAPSQENQTGRIAKSLVGEIGQRQTRDQVRKAPLTRIDSRIQNRVQSRLRNRIDRYYNPSASAISPFIVADQEARTTRQPKP